MMMSLSRKISLKKYNHSDKNKENQKRYRATENRKISLNKYQKSEKAKIVRRKWQKERMKDPRFRLNRAISNGVWCSLKRSKNDSMWQKIVGYSIKDLMEYIEKQFDDKMTWGNYGSYWHIDHIKPKCLFKKEEIIDCWSLNNLQPLEKITNLKKSKKYENNQKFQCIQEQTKR